jgi:hypothetical protein
MNPQSVARRRKAVIGTGRDYDLLAQGDDAPGRFRHLPGVEAASVGRNPRTGEPLNILPAGSRARAGKASRTR